MDGERLRALGCVYVTMCREVMAEGPFLRLRDPNHHMGERVTTAARVRQVPEAINDRDWHSQMAQSEEREQAWLFSL